jgi:5-methylcytosine-specific restriction endonuclease McrA
MLHIVIQKAKNPEHKINSTMFADKTKEEKRDKQARLFSQLDIKENIDIKDLMDYDNCIIIYNQSSLSIELQEIIEQYKYIPNVKCKKECITWINFYHMKKTMFLTVDPSNTHTGTNYKEVKKVCLENDIPFVNQSFPTDVNQIRKIFYAKKHERITFTKEERELFRAGFDGKCSSCKKQIDSKQMDIDHIIPLSCGGTNQLKNVILKKLK